MMINDKAAVFWNGRKFWPTFPVAPVKSSRMIPPVFVAALAALICANTHLLILARQVVFIQRSAGSQKQFVRRNEIKGSPEF